MKIIVEPEDGIGPVIAAVNKAKTSIDIGIFRLDRRDIEEALGAAATRGVTVRTLVAHTNRGGDKQLRQLEHDLLKTGVGVRRTDDDLPRYHNKMMIVDRATLFVLGFNYTALDVKSRSFAVVTKKREMVQEALKLFEADSLRKSYSSPGSKVFLVSPVNARERLGTFLRGARKQLLIYHDPKLTDPKMIRILQERQSAGVSIRILGKAAGNLPAEKFPGRRLHVRAIVRDGQQAFVGSQGLRKLELDSRREVGVIVKDRKIVARIAEVFEKDWAETDGAKQDAAGSKMKDKVGFHAKPKARAK